MDIQWYPGHMVKTKRIIKENLKLVDVILELTDARAPLSTHLPDIDSLRGTKEVIMLLNKSDLADKAITSMWIKYFKKMDFKVVAIDTIRKVGFKKLYSLIRDSKKKTLLGSTRCMVIGVPNVGKSLLLNQMAGRKSAKVANTPGVTRSKMWLKVNRSLELLDTPGILWPKFEDKATGIKLAVLGSIKEELLNLEELSLFLLRFLSLNYPKNLMSRYKVDSDMDPREMLKIISHHRQFLISGGGLDLERSAKTVISEFRRGLLGPVSLEKPEEKEGFWSKI